MRLWLSAALLLVACGTDQRQVEDDQPPISTDTCDASYARYDSVAAPFVINWCRGCHSSSIPEAMRQKAPLDVNFDSEADVRNWADRIEARATSTTPTMPPAGGPTHDERAQLREWIECGMR